MDYTLLTCYQHFLLQITILHTDRIPVDNVDSVLCYDQPGAGLHQQLELFCCPTRLDLHTVYTQHGDMLSVYQGCAVVGAQRGEPGDQPGLEEADLSGGHQPPQQVAPSPFSSPD